MEPLIFNIFICFFEKQVVSCLLSLSSVFSYKKYVYVKALHFTPRKHARGLAPWDLFMQAHRGLGRQWNPSKNPRGYRWASFSASRWQAHNSRPFQPGGSYLSSTFSFHFRRFTIRRLVTFYRLKVVFVLFLSLHSLSSYQDAGFFVFLTLLLEIVPTLWSGADS